MTTKKSRKRSNWKPPPDHPWHVRAHAAAVKAAASRSVVDILSEQREAEEEDDRLEESELSEWVKRRFVEEDVL